MRSLRQSCSGLERIRKPGLKTISGFESKFCLAAGLVSSLRSFADRLGRRWVKGIGMARTLFASSPPRMV